MCFGFFGEAQTTKLNDPGQMSQFYIVFFRAAQTIKLNDLTKVSPDRVNSFLTIARKSRS